MTTHFASKEARTFGFKDVLYEKKDWVARVTINRPESFNCYTTETLRELIAAIDDASGDDAVGVIVLTGAGEKAFCTGGDVKEYSAVYTRRPRDYWKYMGLFSKYIESLLRSGKVTIARINGIAVGGGNESQLACDLAVMADDTYLGQVGTSVGSVACGGATQWLSLHVGDRRAREMLFLNPRIPAAKALEWGLVNRVVPRAKLDEEVLALAKQVLEKFPECTRYTKQQVNYWKEQAWYATVGHARDWLSTHFTTLEPYEGMRAFVEKRKVDFMGLRTRAASGGSSEFLWGPYVKACAKCGATGIPEAFTFCGGCGAALAEPARSG
ncbi:MAG TPA: enoyl-CoA hydratase/isomerase family protein [Gemmatimonadaceae bacterium]|nr:enoyl-CoA hydratase/isomerase family protein [Gemmatimonadaceae bacterium]